MRYMTYEESLNRQKKFWTVFRLKLLSNIPKIQEIEVGRGKYKAMDLRIFNINNAYFCIEAPLKEETL